MIQRKANFILLNISRFISSMGTAVFNFALSLYVLDLTGSAAAFSLVISFSILPRVFINIFAGVFVDHYDKKKIIVFTDLLNGVAVILCLFIFKARPEDIFLIFIYISVITLIQAVYNLAVNAAVPNLVDKKNVSRANAAFQGLGAVINILGPVIGAVAYKTVGMGTIFLLNGISFVISGIGECFLRLTKDENAEIIPEAETYLKKLKLVFNYLKEQKVIGFFLVVAVIINFFYNPLMLMVVKYITYKILKVSAFQLSIIQAGWAAGAILGALYISLQKDTGSIFKSFFFLLNVQGIMILCWIFPVFIKIPDPEKWLTTAIYCFLLVVIGTLNTIQNIPLISYFQIRVPENLRARVFGVFTTSFLISSPLGLYLYGFLMERIHWLIITALSGVIMFAFSIIASGNGIYKSFVTEIKLSLNEKVVKN